MPQDPHFLSEELVLLIHESQLRAYGGESGIIDSGLLSSAIAAPQNLWHYEHAPIFDLAAAYAFHIVKNHPFCDGNKRTGAAAAAVFLARNGYLLTSEFSEEILALIEGKFSRPDLGEFFRQNSRKRGFFPFISSLLRRFREIASI